MEENLVQNFETTENSSFVKSVLLPSLIILVIIAAGGITGYLLSSGKTTVITNGIESVVDSSGGIKEAGVKDLSAYPDKTEGKLEKNDVEGVEGSHKLLRSGGESKTAYLISSVEEVDLDKFVGKCVEVWGQTFTAQKAGWFMDVGKIKVLDSCPSGI